MMTLQLLNTDMSLVPRMPQVELHRIRVHSATEAQAVEHVVRASCAGRGGWVVTPNLDILRRMVRDEAFGDLCQQADLVVADGMPLVWASRVQGTPLPQRVAGSNLIWSLSAAAAKAGLSVFLLGGNPGAAEASALRLAEKYLGLNVCGTACPPLHFEHSDVEMRRVVDALQAARPDIVFVALGSPKQERLIERLRVHLPGSWYLGVGASFSFVSGELRRAPVWMQRAGLEWVHRLVQEPVRLTRRYLIDDVPYAVCLFTAALCQRVRGWRVGSRGAGTAGSQLPDPVRLGTERVFAGRAAR